MVDSKLLWDNFLRLGDVFKDWKEIVMPQVDLHRSILIDDVLLGPEQHLGTYPFLISFYARKKPLSSSETLVISKLRVQPAVRKGAQGVVMIDERVLLDGSGIESQLGVE
jgi:hypothetical protein